jgi:hypothetical protein
LPLIIQNAKKSYLKVSHERDGKIIYGLHLLRIANFPFISLIGISEEGVQGR